MSSLVLDNPSQVVDAFKGYGATFSQIQVANDHDIEKAKLLIPMIDAFRATIRIVEILMPMFTNQSLNEFETDAEKIMDTAEKTVDYIVGLKSNEVIIIQSKGKLIELLDDLRDVLISVKSQQEKNLLTMASLATWDEGSDYSEDWSAYL